MPFKSQQQRRFMYSQHPNIAKEFEKETPAGKLPKKAKKNEQLEGSLGDVYAVQKPFSGCKQASLVTPFNPVVGISMDQLPHDQVHGVFPDKDRAMAVANQLYEKHCEMEEALEEKKIKVTEKLKKTMGVLERMRADSMGLMKENPREAGPHKQKVAELTGKIDELMMKLEKIEMSKKVLEKKNPKKELKEGLSNQDSLSSKQYQDEKKKAGFDKTVWKYDGDLYRRQKPNPKKNLKEGTLADFKKNVERFKAGNVVDTQLKTFYNNLEQADKDKVKSLYHADEEVAKTLSIPSKKK